MSGGPAPMSPIRDRLALLALGRPEQVAVTDGSSSLGWLEALQLADRVASHTPVPARIAICGDPGIKTLSLVAGLMAAKAEVAMLPSVDLGRTFQVLEHWSPDATINVAPSLGSLGSEISDLSGQLRGATPRLAVTRPAIIFATSGSTGIPRLVSCPEDRFLDVTDSGSSPTT
jgi:non-ribosomal peptide synthetase component F